MLVGDEMLVRDVAEVGEGDVDHVVLDVLQRQPKFGLRAAARLLFQVPFAAFAPAEADGAARRHDLAARLVVGDGLPLGVVALAQRLVEVGGAHEAVGDEIVALLHQPNQHRHVGVLAHVVAEIRHLPVDVILFQDHMAHRHGECRVGALLHAEPDVAELRSFRIVRADHGALHAAIARLGVEVGVGRARLRHVRAPQDDEAGVVPVGAFGNVGLLAPGLRGGRRQIAIPVIERHADAADQRQVARARRIRHHRHRRDRREAEDAIGAVRLHRIGIGRRDDLRHFVPVGAHEAAMTALLGVARALVGVLDDRFPCRDRRHGGARLAPQLDEPRTHQRIFHPVAGVEIPAIGRATRAAARLVVRQIGPGARVVGLLRFPGDDAALDVDLPRA